MRKAVAAISLLLAVLLGFFLGHLQRQANASNGRRVLYYQDPMHPDYKSDKPGIAPDCGMQLEAVYADVAATEPGGALPTGSVPIAEDKQQLIGIRVEAAEKSASRNTVRVLGRVAVDETRVYRINAA